MDLKMLPIKTVDPILGSTYKMMQSVDTLGRLTNLERSLNPSKIMRSKAISALQLVGTNAQKELEGGANLEIVKNTMKERLREINMGLRPNKNLLDIYEKAIDGANTPKKLQKCVSKLQKDTISLPTFMLQKTDQGQNGPTHLVSYTRTSKNHLPAVRSYVVKWSNWNEICTSKLYDAISYPFAVPSISVLDFEKPTPLKQSFLDIVGESNQTQDTQLMLMEKVNGSNFIDFAKTKYQYLSEEEKRDLFQKMGQLAMLDLMIGNTDRLIQAYYHTDEEQYRLEDVSANLGNLMIEWFPKEGKLPKLYAIDNGVKPELITDETEKAAYIQFIQDTNNVNGLADVMIRFIQKSFQDTAERLAETTKKPLKETKALFADILTDLKTSTLPKIALAKGLEEMLSNFEKGLPNDKAPENYLKNNHPALLDAVAERLLTLNFRG